MDYEQLHPGYRELAIDDHLQLIKPDVAHAEQSFVWTSTPEVIALMGADFSDASVTREVKRIEDILKSEEENTASISLLQKLKFNEAGTEPYEGLVHGHGSAWRNFKMDRQEWILRDN